MAVYVGPVKATPKTRRWPYDTACRMTADTTAELHRFAAQLGLRSAWYRYGSGVPLYQLTANMRAKALRFGAKEGVACGSARG